MKKFALILILLVSGPKLHAQEGEAALESTKIIKESQWQNWVFAATAIVTAATAVYLVSLDNGRKAH